MLTAPVGPLSVSLDGSIRQAGDLRTPTGELGNTALSTYNAAAGVSRVGRYGYVGGAGSYYFSEYGIPGGFVGAHPDGVDVRIGSTPRCAGNISLSRRGFSASKGARSFRGTSIRSSSRATLLVWSTGY